MRELRKKIQSIISKSFKIGDKFIAQDDDMCFDPPYQDYVEGDMCQLIEINHNDIGSPFTLKNLDNKEYFSVKLDMMYDFEKIELDLKGE